MSESYMSLAAPMTRRICIFHKEASNSVEELLEILSEPYWSDEMRRIDDRIAWNHLVLIFRRLGLDDTDFRSCGATEEQWVPWQRGDKVPDCPDFKQNFINAMCTRLRERMA